MQFILNNEVVDYYRANELFDEIKYNQIEILKIEQKLAKLKAKYDKLMAEGNHLLDKLYGQMCTALVEDRNEEFFKLKAEFGKLKAETYIGII
jgi:hypothetical protein